LKREGPLEDDDSAVDVWWGSLVVVVVEAVALRFIGGEEVMGTRWLLVMSIL
jgi:steroid 5-alpha reductase family enzyme